MPMHFTEKEGIFTVVRGNERIVNYDLPKGAYPESLEAKIQNNYNAIEAWKQTESKVRNSPEWAHFTNHLQNKGISQSLIDYLSGDDINYVAGPVPQKKIIAGTIPYHTTLTYIVPPEYVNNIQEFARKNKISDYQAELMVYLHEAMHNVLHDYRRDQYANKNKVESEVETALTDYFTERAANAESDEEKEFYLELAAVTSNRINRYGRARDAFKEGRISREKLAAIEEELEEYIDEMNDYDNQYETESDEFENNEDNDNLENDNFDPQGTETIDDVAEFESNQETEGDTDCEYSEAA
tara:strand:- start:418 stop:1311 length:894 start_codon:yes stop_codon:yes gene_type:complete